MIPPRKTAEQAEKVAEWVARTLDAMPPPSAEERARIGGLLFDTARRRALPLKVAA